MEALKKTDISGNEVVYRAFFNQHNLGELTALPEIKFSSKSNEYQIYSNDDSLGKTLKLNQVHCARIVLRCKEISANLNLLAKYADAGSYELRLEPFTAYRGCTVSFANCEFLPEAKLVLGGRNGRSLELNFLAKSSNNATNLFICT